MFNNIIKRVFGDPDERDVKRLQPIVEEISHLEDEFEKKSVDELRALTEGYRIQIQESVAPLQEELEAARDRWQSEIDAASQMPLRAEVDQLDRKLHAAENEAMEEIIPQAFAAVREAAKRTLGLRHYDRQLMGGVILHRGTIAEMKTGEGKTLAATLPLYLNALTGRGVHLVTVNDYLARRDAGWMGQIFYLLGLSTGFIAQDVSALYDPDYVDPGADQEDERLVHLRPCPRRLAYEADITYGTNTEFGFDYLRDNMATDVNELVQRELNYAIIDEVDNILIDEARTPLIISGPAEESSDEYRRFAKLVRELRLTRNTAEKDAPVNGDYTIEDRTKAITLTERGIELVERELSRQGILDLDAGDSIYDAAHYELTHYMENALKAQFIFQRDKDYIVQNNEVIIVDEFTGRLMSGRRWSEGLHQAVEAKEGVHVQRETVTVGTVTVQNYFRMYHKRAGMTGTAATEKEEFHRIYNLDVAVIPTAKPMIRHDAVDQVYARETGKFKAIVAEIQQLNQSGRPVLVGTTSVETSERLSEFLKKDHIEHKVLNAKEHTREAGVIAQAGRPGTVTIATNMAGRGTDIILGGNPESLAAHEIERKLFNRESLGRVLSLAVDGQLPKAREAARRERGLTDGLIEAGLALQQQYEKAVQEETDRGPSGYRVQLLQARSKLDYDAASEVVRALDGHDTARARELLKDHGESEALVTEIEKRVEEIYEFRRARAGTKSLAAFLTAELFERHYNARAALIRSVLADDIEHARELVKNTPALAEDLIKDIQAVQQRWREDQQRVLQAGGLHILGTERHEARRIDNQLRGRAGRQGDPGSSQFYLSLEDDLMQRFGGDRIRNLAERLGMDDSQPLQVGLIGRSIETAQERVEGYNFDIRKQVLEYDDVVNKQREAIYRQRRAILEGQADLTAQIKQYFYSEIEHIVDRYVVNYDTWMQTQIDQAINDFTSPTTDEVSVEGILRHLQGILPQVQTVDAEQLAGLNARDLGQELSALIEDSRQAHVNLFLLFGDAGRFVDLIPRMPVVWQNREKALSAADMRQSYDAFMHDAVWVYAGATGQLAGAQDEAATEQPDESAAPDGPDGVGELQPAPAGAMSVPVNITVPGEMAQRIDQAFKALPLTSLSAANIERQQKQLWAKLNEVMTWSVVMGWSPMSSDKISELLCRMLDEKMARYERAIGQEQMQTFERWFLLFTIDQNWRHYLTDIDDLRQGIGLEAFGQRDPLIEFKRQGFQMFEELQNTIDRSVVYNFFLQLPHHQTWVEQQQQAREAANRNYRIQQRGKGPSKGMTVQRGTKVGRNELCPCGSGKKYKNCHGRADGAARLSDGQGQGQPNEAAGAKRNGGSQLRRER